MSYRLGLRSGLTVPAPAAPPGGFDPATLFAASEPGVWYDPSPTTTFTDTGGTTPAAVGDLVAYVTDLSGNGFHATQADAAKRPVLRQNGALYYLEFDGVNDAMATATITPGTDKVQAFAGVRKITDPSFAMIAEFSASIGTNFGTFNVQTRTSNYVFTSRGTNQGIVVPSTNPDWAAPTTEIFTGLGDISGDTATLRIDGVQIGQDTADQGTGSYLNYPLYVGGRAASSLLFGGYIYSMIIRFGPNLDATTIDDTEAYIADKTGVTL